MGKNRIEWLDIAKGYGILLVVLGHCVSISSPKCQMIFAFHMPLFFLLSGYTSKKSDLLPFIGKRIKSLVVPYIVFVLIGLAVTLIEPMWKKGFSWKVFKTDMLVSYPNSVHNSSIWFLSCMFFVVVIFQLLLRLSPFGVFSSVVVIYFAGYWYALHHTEFTVLGNHRLPLVLDVVPAGLLFFALGYAARKYGIVDKVTTVFEEIWMLIIGLVGVYFMYKLNGYVNVHALLWRRPLYFVIGGIAGTVAVVMFSKLTARLGTVVGKAIRTVFGFYGKNSLIVLGLQSLLIRLYSLYMLKNHEVVLHLYQFPRNYAIYSFIIVSIECGIAILLYSGAKKGTKLAISKIKTGVKK